MERKKYTWKTAKVIRETTDAVTIVFDTKGIPFHYIAGQFINVSLVINGEIVSRSYSLSSSPTLDHSPSITVKSVENGLMSRYIFSNADEINVWEIEGPGGLFHLTDNMVLTDQAVFIAGGSGITPIYSMVRYLLHRSSMQITLIYSTKQWEETIFRRDLAELEKKFLTRLKVHYAITGGDKRTEPAGTNTLNGRLSKIILKKLMKQVTVPGSITNYFVCGPNGLIEKTEEALSDLRIEKEYIHKEYFAPPSTSKIVLPAEPMEVLLHFQDQSNLLEVSPGKSILDAAMDDKIPLPYSCKNGTCGVCVAKLTEGNVHMANNYALDESQLQQGYRLLCQSHPLDNKVRVEID